ncbi:MAG: hypothetical protein NZ870_02890, partial [bacterium]|nr:hypothetical protein [bacterium]
ISTDIASVFNNAELIETSYNYSIGTSWQITDFLNISPNYSFSKTEEERRFKETALELFPTLKNATFYPKRQSHSFGLTGSLNIFGFTPTSSYRANINETNNLPTSLNTTAYYLKSIDRSITFDTSIGFSGYKLASWLPIFNRFNFSISNSKGIGDTYENIEYDKDLFIFLFDESNIVEKLNSKGKMKTLTLRNSERYSGNAQPFSEVLKNPRLEFLRRLSLTLTLTKSTEHTEQFNSFRDVISLVWPDLIIQTGGFERMFRKTFFSDSVLQFRYSERFQETLKISRSDEKNSSGDFSFSIFNNLKPLFTFSYREFLDMNLQFGKKNRSGFNSNNSVQLGFFYRKVSFTTRLSYSKDFEVDSLDRPVRDSNTTGFDLSMYYDTVPKAFLFFTKLPAQRLVTTLNASFIRTESSVNIQATNIDTFTLGGSLDYTIGANLRANAGLGGSLSRNRYLPKEDIFSLDIKFGVALQF